ncbi:POM121-like protein 12 [Pteropus medius]|uniref:POM121-like protein 12 n=1 Tax=Pteropus vampyrus TaxID=132908 RepID=UPI00196A3186|nr:POM121-like protein 12 [Pteropus giganteus]XP_039729311.1 POM121-like protein 12 [Pteropus giganteus]XP_039729320.1 POM121-like protein 12 [Pteropus giganteus]
MGSYLSRGKATLPPSTGARQSPPPRPARHQRGCDQCRDTHVHLKCEVCNQPLPTTPPGQNYTRGRRAMVPEAWRRFPSRPPLWSFTGPDFSSNEKAFMRQWLRNARNPQRIRSPVIVTIAPPERKGSLYRCAPVQELPDPCARETVLKALSQCKKGRKKFDGPLWFEISDATSTQLSPERRPSAFKPVRKNGETLPFVPRPGPLRRASERTPICELTATLPEPPPSAAQPAARTPPAQATVTASAGELRADQHSAGPDVPQCPKSQGPATTTS